LKKYKAKLLVGSLDSKKVEATAVAAPPPSPPATPPQAESRAVVAAPAVEETETLEPYGDLIPFADPSWYQGVGFPLELPRAQLSEVKDANMGANSITPHTSTKHTPPSEQKFANGSRKKSSLLSGSGTRPRRSQIQSIRRWARVATWPA
jgi:hypothetical protein